MKKKTLSMALAVPVFAISMLLCSCNSKTTPSDDSTASDTAKTPDAGPAYVLASDLAIKSLLSKGADLASIKNLYKINEVALLQLKAVSPQGPCCFPCPIIAECPGFLEGWAIIGRNDWDIRRILLGDHIFKPVPFKSDPKWTVYKSDNEINLQNGTQHLTMTATFFGKDSAEYSLPIVFKDGKAYMIE
ncbi:MAG: hypothetical protein ABIR06_03055 [Cyclobacteriaceae bacterium]